MASEEELETGAVSDSTRDTRNIEDDDGDDDEDEDDDDDEDDDEDEHVDEDNEAAADAATDESEDTVEEEPVTYRILISSFVDFLTVAVHTILYERALYPQTSFLTARKYNFAVRQSRHPKVCAWINDAITAVETELLKAAVDKIVVVIYTKANKPVERYVFDASEFPEMPPDELDTALEAEDEDGDEIEVLPLEDWDEQLRALLSRMTSQMAKLKPLPPGCTFTIAIELNEEGKAPVEHPQPWMPVEIARGREAPANTTTALRAVSAGELHFQAWIEEVNQSQEAQRDGPRLPKKPVFVDPDAAGKT